MEGKIALVDQTINGALSLGTKTTDISSIVNSAKISIRSL